MAIARIPLIFGTMTMGSHGKSGVRTTDLAECQAILDVYFNRGYRELDTARMYGEGTTEETLSQLDLQDATIDTKVYPYEPGIHSPSKLRAHFMSCLESLKRDKVRTFYLHAPDRSVPFEETCEEVNNIYNEGLFEIFGLSNYAAWEVAEIVGICKARGYVMPKIYQGMYNAITRDIESELIPCLRKFGLRLVIYNPLAGGFFAGHLSNTSDPGPEGGRFDPNTRQGSMYRERYVKDGYFESLKFLQSVASDNQLTLTEIALRWCQHHSLLIPTDGVILGASSVKHLQDNCTDSAKGPLPEAVVKALDEAHRIVKQYGSEPKYWR